VDLVAGGGGRNALESVIESAGEFVGEAELGLGADLITQPGASLISDDKVLSVAKL